MSAVKAKLESSGAAVTGTLTPFPKPGSVLKKYSIFVMFCAYRNKGKTTQARIRNEKILFMVKRFEQANDCLHSVQVIWQAGLMPGF